MKVIYENEEICETVKRIKKIIRKRGREERKITRKWKNRGFKMKKQLCGKEKGRQEGVIKRKQMGKREAGKQNKEINKDGNMKWS